VEDSDDSGAWGLMCPIVSDTTSLHFTRVVGLSLTAVVVVIGGQSSSLVYVVEIDERERERVCEARNCCKNKSISDWAE